MHAQYTVSANLQHALDMEIATALGFLDYCASNASPLEQGNKKRAAMLAATLTLALEVHRNERKFSYADR